MAPRRFSFDIILTGMTLILCGIGVLILFSASKSQEERFGFNFASKQLYWLAFAAAVFLLTLVLSYQRFLDFVYPLYILSILALLSVVVVGSIRYGAQRWINLGGMMVQPVEFVKIATILMLAHYFGNTRYNLHSFKSLIAPLVILSIPFGLVLIQPDLGSALTLIPVFFAMAFVAGSPLKYLGVLTLGGLMISPVAWSFLRDYQKNRLLVFIDPNVDPLGAGYTIIQSKIAIGSGGLWGKGWLAGTQNLLNFLPERHTDFIFSVVGEEWGFIGSASILVLYFILLWRALGIAQNTHDIFGRLIAVGIIAMFAFQIFVNIGMTMGLMPVVGLPLPFLSYGGSSLLVSVMSVALILSISLRAKY